MKSCLEQADTTEEVVERHKAQGDAGVAGLPSQNILCPAPQLREDARGPLQDTPASVPLRLKACGLQLGVAAVSMIIT